MIEQQTVSIPHFLRDVIPEKLAEIHRRLSELDSVEKDEWILTVDAEYTNEWLNLPHGITTGITLEEFVKLGQGHFSFRRRKELESDPRNRHLITYDVIIQHNEAGNGLELIVYTRTKWAGEAKLHGGRSIGIGGHIDKASTIHKENGLGPDLDRPDIELTLKEGIYQERYQELSFYNRKNNTAVPSVEKRSILKDPANNHFVGLLCDNEDPKKTGDFHIGLVSMLVLPKGVYAETHGKEEEFYGALPLLRVLEVPKLERWSVILAEFLRDRQATLYSVAKVSDL